jgi:hypothetical protein
MIGHYRRVPVAKLNDLLSHPESLAPFLYPDEEPDESRHLDIDKTWHIIHFLLTNSTWEGEWPLVGAVFGGAIVSDEDVGYGPARYLTPQEVVEVTSGLSDISPDSLWSNFDSNAVREAEIYPRGWSETPEDREYVTRHYARLRDFFAAAAKAGEVVIEYLN